MGRNGVPEDHPPLGTELFKNAVDDRPGGFLPRSWAAARPTEGITPAQQVELAGEGNPGPPHPLIAGRFPNGDNIGLSPFREVIAKIGEPEGGRVREVVRAGVSKLVEGGANRQRRELAEQRLDLDRL